MVFFPDDEETTNKGGAPPVQVVGQPGPLSAASPATPVGESSPSGPSRTTGGFAGITQYLAKNAPATQRLGEQAAGSIQQKGEAARQAVSQAGQQFESAVAPQQVNQNQQIQDALRNDPASLTSSPEQAAAFQQQFGANYTGPSTLEETEYYAPAQSAVKGAQESAKLSETEGGRTQLLSQLTSGGDRRRTRGSLLLDSALLQASPTARTALERARGSQSDLDSRLQGASEAARARASSIQGTNAATQAAARAALGEARGTLETDLDTRVSAARNAALARNAAAKSSLLGVSQVPFPTERGERKILGPVGGLTDAPTAQALADLGLTPEDWEKINAGVTKYEQANLKPKDYGFRIGKKFHSPASFDTETLGDFVNELSPEAGITRSNVASPQDFARYAALNELAGEAGTFLDPSQQALAGTAPQELTDLDLEALLTALEGLSQGAQITPGRFPAGEEPR